MKIIVVFEQDGPHFSAYLPDFPGCVAVGESFEEVRELIRGGIMMHFPVLDGDPRMSSSPHLLAAEIYEIPDDIWEPAGRGE